LSRAEPAAKAAVSFRRARYQPRGRPDGGNGGQGGDVILEASRHERTLVYFRPAAAVPGRQRPGRPGTGLAAAKTAPPWSSAYPLGTLIYDA
jgi:GTPase